MNKSIQSGMSGFKKRSISIRKKQISSGNSDISSIRGVKILRPGQLNTNDSEMMSQKSKGLIKEMNEQQYATIQAYVQQEIRRIMAENPDEEFDKNELEQSVYDEVLNNIDLDSDDNSVQLMQSMKIPLGL